MKTVKKTFSISKDLAPFGGLDGLAMAAMLTAPSEGAAINGLVAQAKAVFSDPQGPRRVIVCIQVQVQYEHFDVEIEFVP